MRLIMPRLERSVMLARSLATEQRNGRLEQNSRYLFTASAPAPLGKRAVGAQPGVPPRPSEQAMSQSQSQPICGGVDRSRTGGLASNGAHASLGHESLISVTRRRYLQPVDTGDVPPGYLPEKAGTSRPRSARKRQSTRRLFWSPDRPEVAYRLSTSISFSASLTGLTGDPYRLIKSFC